MATLAILSALAEEQQGLLACLSQPVCLRRAGREVWRGRWQGHEVLLALMVASALVPMWYFRKRGWLK